MKAYELRAATGLSKLFMGQNKTLEAHECLDEITRWFQEGFDTAELYEAEQLMGPLSTLLEKDSHITDHRCANKLP